MNGMNLLKGLLLAWFVEAGPIECGDNNLPLLLTSALKKCEIVRGVLLIDESSDGFTLIKKLKEIQGKLIVKTSMPRKMKRKLSISELYIQGSFETEPLDFVNIIASNLTIDGVASNLGFNMTPEALTIKDCYFQQISGLKFLISSTYP
ncbi:hypothetical protein DSO57_1014593 [Entomophthora muscae]|uniref:Uncharacterized protein n=1 Tax=Entomophthora muscae TaxID=34485 RepID=A0ACC2UF37_9FUNG|nr:hypothetical protein DSO57_1014593 [Entomophthora muscae]